MKRFKHLLIGGIQSKIFNLILCTVILLAAAFAGIALYQSRTLSALVSDTGDKQQSAIADTTSLVMDSVVKQTLIRSNQTQAAIADGLFDAARDRVAFLAENAARVLDHPEDYTPQSYAGPDPADDGKWTAKVIYAEGVDPSDPAIVSRVGLLANLSDTMISLCRSFNAATVYIALPEGVHFSVSDTSSSWFVDGKARFFDPRERGWYQQAAKTGKLIFTDGEWDANTGAYCIECAMPVYGADGTLLAVVGTDMFLDDMQGIMRKSLVEGEAYLLVNRNGIAVLDPESKNFPISDADMNADLRISGNAFMAQVVSDALQGKNGGVSLGEMEGGTYYIAASSIETTGWVLVSSFDESVSSQPVTLLQSSNAQIQHDAMTAYHSKSGSIRTQAWVLLGSVLVLALTGALVLGSRIVKPLNRITRRISELSDSNLEFKMEDTYKTGDEVEALAKSFAAISHKTVEYMDSLVKVTAEKERIGAELSLATQIQAAMLPHIFPPFPDRHEFEIFGSMDPAKEVGGDFFDYFLIDDDHLGLLIADVSGKGVPAALFMMASKIILQSVAMLGGTPAEILNKTNEAICSNNEAQMFVTVWIGILEISTGKLTAANAGHEYPVLRRPGGQFEVYKDRHGFVIGGMEGVRYREYELQMEPGSKLFVYTDGVPEATNAEKELFGMDRMLNALNADPTAVPQRVLKNVRAAVDDFVQDAEQFDDLTMLCLTYKGATEKGGQAS